MYMQVPRYIYRNVEASTKELNGSLKKSTNISKQLRDVTRSAVGQACWQSNRCACIDSLCEAVKRCDSISIERGSMFSCHGCTDKHASHRICDTGSFTFLSPLIFLFSSLFYFLVYLDYS